MNRLLTIDMATSEALKPSTVWDRNTAAFFSLVLTERRLSWRYRRWALEAADAGNLEENRRDIGEARRLWRSAKGHLSLARHHRDLGARHG